MERCLQEGNTIMYITKCKAMQNMKKKNMNKTYTHTHTFVYMCNETIEKNHMIYTLKRN